MALPTNNSQLRHRAYAGSTGRTIEEGTRGLGENVEDLKVREFKR